MEPFYITVAKQMYGSSQLPDALVKELEAVDLLCARTNCVLDSKKVIASIVIKYLNLI